MFYLLSFLAGAGAVGLLWSVDAYGKIHKFSWSSWQLISLWVGYGVVVSGGSFVMINWLGRHYRAAKTGGILVAVSLLLLAVFWF